MDISSLNHKIEEILKDTNKRFASCALQKDTAFIQSLLDKKADLDYVTESLSQKANKQSVANALHRKANRSDVEDMLASKVEVQEFQHL